MLQTSNLILIKKGNLEYLKFPKFEKSGLVRHLFSTKHGGISTGDCASMNLGFRRGEPKETVLKNYQILCDAEGINVNHLVLCNQTHTNNVKIVNNSDCLRGIFKEPFCDVDGLITNCAGVALVTQYADCTPLLFLDPVKKVIASSHSGWRGTVKQIGKVTVEKMCTHFGSNPKDIIVGIGPTINECCYEVDSPVIKEFEKLRFLDKKSCFTEKENGKFMLNLREANRQILINAGILPQNIDISDLCTCCNKDDLFSHRATNGRRGNLGMIIELIS